MNDDDIDGEPTRKQRREQARAQRRELEEAQAAGASRRKQLRLLGGAAAVVVIVIVVALATGGAKKIEPKEETTVTKQVAALIGGIDQSGDVLGKPSAPVTLEYFGDLECSICQKFTVDTLPTIIRRWVAAGDLRIEYHSLETATREPETFKKQQVAALAAGEQDKMWYFVETFYHEQGEEGSGYVTESYIDRIAKQVPGLNLALWQTDRSDPMLAAQVEEDARTANAKGFTATPSFLIGRSGGATSTLGIGLLAESTFNQAIEKLLKA